MVSKNMLHQTMVYIAMHLRINLPVFAETTYINLIGSLEGSKQRTQSIIVLQRHTIQNLNSGEPDNLPSPVFEFCRKYYQLKILENRKRH